jgi:hypothetical protein
VLAWVMPDRKDGAGAVAGESSTFTTKSTQSGVGDIRDEGVVWTGTGRPMRKVTVIYLDRVVMRNQQGERVEVEMPRFETILVPERVD